MKEEKRKQERLRKKGIEEVNMSIEGKIDNDLKKALKKREKVRLSTLRMLKSQLKNEAIEKRDKLTEEEEFKVIGSYLKKLKDSLETYEKSGRKDLVKQLEEEISIVEAYLPPSLTSQELRAIIEEIVAEVGKDKKNMGKIMKEVMSKVGSRADGRKVKEIVDEILQG